LTRVEYEKLLKRISDKIIDSKKDSGKRFEIPTPDIMWQGNRTFLRNFAEFPKAFRRDAGKVLQYLSKEFATPAEIAGDKAIFVGKRGPQDFELLLQRYVKDYLECPTCKIPDTKIEKVNRLTFLVCEACGAKSIIKGQYA